MIRVTHEGPCEKGGREYIRLEFEYPDGNGGIEAFSGAIALDKMQEGEDMVLFYLPDRNETTEYPHMSGEIGGKDG